MTSTSHIIAITAIVLSVITLLANSDELKAEFLTSFEVYPEIAYPEQETIFVRNTGLLQANNVVLTLYANGTIDNFRDVCPEGTMYRMDDKTLVTKFQRMSPNMVCGLELTVSKPVSFNVAITSDHRSTWAPNMLPSYSLIYLYTMITAMIASYIGALILLSNSLGKSEFIHSIEFWRRRDQFKKAKLADEICEFVLEEYDQCIKDIDATVLEHIYNKKKTKNQLAKYSGLSIKQVKYRIWKLRQLELLEDPMDLNSTLHEYFESMPKQ